MLAHLRPEYNLTQFVSLIKSSFCVVSWRQYGGNEHEAKSYIRVPYHSTQKGSTRQFSAVISVYVHELGWNLYLHVDYKHRSLNIKLNLRRFLRLLSR